MELDKEKTIIKRRKECAEMNTGRKSQERDSMPTLCSEEEKGEHSFI